MKTIAEKASGEILVIGAAETLPAGAQEALVQISAAAEAGVIIDAAHRGKGAVRIKKIEETAPRQLRRLRPQLRAENRPLLK